MCGTMASMILMGIQTAGSTLGSLVESESQARQQEYMAQVATANAQFTQNEANLQAMQAEAERGQMSRQAAQLYSRQMNQLVASGRDPFAAGTTAQDILLDTTEGSARDVGLNRMNSYIEGVNAYNEYNMLNADAANYRSAAKTSRRIGYLNAATNLGTGIAGAYISSMGSDLFGSNLPIRGRSTVASARRGR